jgi:hypothetical protein
VRTWNTVSARATARYLPNDLTLYLREGLWKIRGEIGRNPRAPITCLWLVGSGSVQGLSKGDSPGGILTCDTIQVVSGRQEIVQSG